MGHRRMDLNTARWQTLWTVARPADPEAAAGWPWRKGYRVSRADRGKLLKYSPSVPAL